MCAVAEDREPENSAADAARSVALVLAARDSAEQGGVPVPSEGRRDRAGRGRRRGAGRPGARPGVRRGLAELEPDHVVPASAPPAAAPDEEWQHLMRFRPGTPVAPSGVQGEGLLVVDPGNGAPARLYGTAGPGRRADPPRDLPRATTVVVRATGPVDVTAPRRRRRGRARGVRRRVRRRPSVAPAAPTRRRCGAPGTATSRRSPPPTSWRTSRPSTSTTCRSTWCRSTTGGAPVSARGCVPAPRFGSLPALVDAIRASAGGPGSGWRRSWSGRRPRWPASTRTGWSGPPATTGARTSSASTSPTPACATCCATHLRRLVALGVDYLKLDFLYAGACPARGTRTWTRWRPTAPGSRWSARRSAPTSTSSAAAHRCCPASGWSTPCGSRPTPSTRAARTAPPGCAA